MTDAPVPLPDPARLRASNDDRERVASVLNQAMAQGRITVPELQERLDIVYAARTIGELEPVTRDLPEHRPLVPPVVPPSPALLSPALRVGGTPSSAAAVAVLSGAQRSGEWVVPARFTAVAIMGGVDLNLTRASFAERECTITAVAIMGGIDITVPDGVRVEVNGVGLMGAFEQSTTPLAGGSADLVVLRVNGAAIMGGVDVHRPRSGPVLLGKG